MPQKVLKFSKYVVAVLVYKNMLAQPAKAWFSHFDIICDLLLNKRTAIWNPFVQQKK